MKFKNELIEARLIKREKRFIAYIDYNGKIVKAHVPNTGRLRELAVKDAEVLISQNSNPLGKTDFKLHMIKKDSHWISIESVLANQLTFEGISTKIITELEGYRYLKREIKHLDSRIDFFLFNNWNELPEYMKVDNEKKFEKLIEKSKIHIIDSKYYNKDLKPAYLEVKGVTLEKEGWGYFPDAPTLRGARHINEIAALVQEGYRGIILFVGQHPNIKGFSPNEETDPDFANTLIEAEKTGVEILSYVCTTGKFEIKLDRKIPISLRP